MANPFIFYLKACMQGFGFLHSMALSAEVSGRPRLHSPPTLNLCCLKIIEQIVVGVTKISIMPLSPLNSPFAICHRPPATTRPAINSTLLSPPPPLPKRGTNLAVKLAPPAHSTHENGMPSVGLWQSVRGGEGGGSSGKHGW